MSSPVRVYIETTVISYLTARPSKNPVQEGRRQVTLSWWGVRRKDFSTVISPLVVDEARQGDSEAVRARLAALEGIPTLGLEESARDLA